MQAQALSKMKSVTELLQLIDRVSLIFFPSPFSLKVVRYVWVHCISPSVAFGSFQNLRVFLTYFNFILLFFIPQDRRERGLATMKELLRQKTYQGALSKLSSPLDPSFKLRNLKLVFLLWVPLVCSFSHGPVLVASSSDESRQEFKKARESACQSSKHWRHQLACFFCRLL